MLTRFRARRAAIPQAEASAVQLHLIATTRSWWNLPARFRAWRIRRRSEYLDRRVAEWAAFLRDTPRDEPLWPGEAL